jgi:predicted lipase
LSLVKVKWEQSTCSGCEVHSGFADYYNKLKSGILAHIKDIKSKNTVSTILVTGHSLGAAVATLAAVDLI